MFALQSVLIFRILISTYLVFLSNNSATISLGTLHNICDLSVCTYVYLCYWVLTSISLSFDTLQIQISYPNRKAYFVLHQKSNYVSCLNSEISATCALFFLFPMFS